MEEAQDDLQTSKTRLDEAEEAVSQARVEQSLTDADLDDVRNQISAMRVRSHELGQWDQTIKKTLPVLERMENAAEVNLS